MRLRNTESPLSEKSRERLQALDREMAQLRVRLRELTESYPLDSDDRRRRAAAPTAPARGEAPLRDRPAVAGGERDRERFVHYFASADLARAAPQLRWERIAQRNRAIVTAILALFLLGAVILLWLRHQG
jgi:hypothetical protein